MAALAQAAEARVRRRRDCERRIEEARAEVFALGDGVVGARMTALEREWRAFAKSDRADEGPLRDLWAAIAPPAWVDEPRYRESAAEVRAAAAVVLASDPEGVARAESAARVIAAALRAEGMAVGPRVSWRVERMPRIVTPNRALFAGARARVIATLRATDAWAVVSRRAIEQRRHVARRLRDVSRRTSGQPLATEVGYAAFVDALFAGAAALGLSAAASPVEPFRTIWRSGYLVAEIGRSGVVLAAPLY